MKTMSGSTCMRTLFALSSLSTITSASYLQPLPDEFGSLNASWAFVTYDNPSYRVLPQYFNRSAVDAPVDTDATAPALQEFNAHVNETCFVAYDSAFFDLIGPSAKVTRVFDIPFQIHEAACLVPGSDELFFTQWGPDTHTSQYLLNTTTFGLRNLTTDPPLVNVHGCKAFKDKLYIVNDGGDGMGAAELAEVDPKTWKKTSLVNHYYEQPFGTFNDIDIDAEGNFYVTDPAYRGGFNLAGTTPPTAPGTYFINGTTLRPKLIQLQPTGDTNGVALSPDGKTIYLPSTGTAPSFPLSVSPTAKRGVYAYDFALDAQGNRVPVLINERLLNMQVYYIYDGFKASKEGYLFGAAGQGVDVIDPISGQTLGSIRIGGGKFVVTNLVFEKNGIWITGQGGVWHVEGVALDLA